MNQLTKLNRENLSDIKGGRPDYEKPILVDLERAMAPGNCGGGTYNTGGDCGGGDCNSLPA